jgi:Pvc16 N-terminal domain
LPFGAQFAAFATGLTLVCRRRTSRNDEKVIPEVDHALRTLIEREAVDPTEVEVEFDAPTKDWASRRNAPTIDVYLYDIREDLRRRERGLLNEYDGNQVLARRLPPRYFKLSYLVAAWTQRPEDEHRLLAALMGCFLRYEALPTDVLTGSLAALALPVPITLALPPPEDRSFADVWTALGGELKPSLDIVVTAPTDTGRSFPAGPPVQKPIVVVAEGLGGSVPREARRRHVVGDATTDDATRSTAAVRVRKRQSKQ